MKEPKPDTKGNTTLSDLRVTGFAGAFIIWLLSMTLDSRLFLVLGLPWIVLIGVLGSVKWWKSNRTKWE